MDNLRFDELALSQPVLRALAAMDYTTPTAIQAEAIPHLLAGRDLVGQARTGTGKTAAFAIPAVEAALAGRLTVVLVPTRELAQQVATEVDAVGKDAGVRALALYGGAPMRLQVKALQAGDRAILVATPGRLRDHVERGTVDLSAASLVVLDEADEMLKMGFVEEVEAVLGAVGAERQTLLFSATMPEPVVRLAEKYLRDPVFVDAREGDAPTNATTEQFVVHVRHPEKVDTLVRILAAEHTDAALVFRHTREQVDELVQALAARGLAAEGLHGGMAQPVRDTVIERLRAGRAKVVVATNVAARGLDVDQVTHVVNYDAPRETDAYVHRVGRTGRAGRSGRTFLFVTPNERSRLRFIERALGERLRAYEVPDDAAVHAAVDARLGAWLAAQPKDDLDRHLAAVDAAVASGEDLRTLAAVALRAAAKHAGLDAPPLERLVRAPPPGEFRPRREGQKGPAGPRAAIAFNVGKMDGVRPGDLVGALANEGGLAGADVGRIDLLPRMSVAEVPFERAEEVLARMQGTTIRGRQARPRLAPGWEFKAVPGPRGQRDGAPRRARAGSHPR